MRLTVLLLAVAVATAACAPVAETEEPGVNPDLEQRLLSAASAGDDAAVRDALEDGADLESRGEGEMTALIIATRANHVDVARTLIEAGADVNAQDDIQDSAYLYAGARGHDEILRLTLEHGADLSSTNRFGGTALIPASERGLLSTVQILLDAGVDPNHVNNLGWTALHEAIVLGDGSHAYVRVIEALLEGGADPTIADGEGASPRELATTRGYDQVVAVIDAH